MIPVLLVVLMQMGGAYTHVPKLTLFPKPAPVNLTFPLGPGSLTLAAPPAVIVKAFGASDRCSVRMPRMAIPKDVEFQIRVVKPAVTDPQSIVAPAPECPAN